jgi:hypothetical protein
VDRDRALQEGAAGDVQQGMTGSGHCQQGHGPRQAEAECERHQRGPAAPVGGPSQAGVAGPGAARGPGGRDTEGAPPGPALLATPDTILRWHRDIVPSGVDPAPLRQTAPTRQQFLRSQAEAILACDFFSVGLLDGTQAYVLAVIEHATRRIRILGVTLHPTGEWTAQQARRRNGSLRPAGSSSQ